MTISIRVTMSYGWLGESGTMLVSPSSIRSGRSVGVKNGATSMLFDGRNDSR